jgi:FkbM family methyltransferase
MPHGWQGEFGMADMELAFFGSKNKKTVFDRRMYGFFGQMPILERVCNSLPIMLQLLKNGSFHGIFLVFKAGFMTLIGRPDESLSAREQAVFWTGLIGFWPSRIECRAGKVDMAFDMAGVETASVFYLFFEIVRANIYNVSKETAKNKVIVDAGANIGLFSIYAAKMGAKRVYAFEPVAETFNQLKKNIAMNGLGKVIKPINRALGSRKGVSEISYDSCGDGAASLEFLDKVGKRQAVQVDTIDKFMGKPARVDFIKMDVEGYEGNVLMGAAKTIKLYKPYLVMSAYHKPNDRTSLVRILKNIRKDYSCHLEERYELDIYCE